MTHFSRIAFLSLLLAACVAPIADNGSMTSSSSSSDVALGSSSSSSSPSLLEGGQWYTNEAVGYSILIPTVTTQWAPMHCSQQVDTVPVVAVEDGERAIITRAYEYSDSCEKINHDKEWMNDLFSRQQRGISWMMGSITAHTDADLDAFIKERYGKDCSLGAKEPTAQEGTFDVRINGFGAPENGYDCFVNYMTALKYSPAKRMLVYWDMGQDASFPGGPTYAYDIEMEKSFRFE